MNNIEKECRWPLCFKKDYIDVPKIENWESW
jgi:hypothetical protein